MTNPMHESPASGNFDTRHSHPVARWLTVASVLLILYGSLFPFRFAQLGESGFFDLLTSLRFQRTSRADLVANLFLYMPLGLCLLMCWPSRWGPLQRLSWTVLIGTTLSCAIEMLQVHAPSRVSSLTDVVVNACGTLVGASIALIYVEIGSTIRIPGIAPGRPDPAPLGIVFLWLAFRLAPFFPALDWQKFKEALRPIFLEPRFGLLDTYRYMIGWLVVGYAVRCLWRREYAMHALLAMVLIVLLGRIIVVGKVLVAPEILALVISIPLAAVMVALTDQRRAGLLALLLASVIALQGLKPFELLAQPHSFSWVPFMNSLSDSLEVNYSILLEKGFWYFSLVWLLTRRGIGILPATAMTTLLVALVEVAQLWLPQRSAEITDPLLAFGAGIIVALFSRPGALRAAAPR
jgi:VanZ family protein